MSFKIFQKALTALFLTLFFCCYGNDKADPQRKLIALKKGEAIYLRSYFSPGRDILIFVKKGRNGQFNFFNTRLISDAAPSDEASFSKGIIVHNCGDDTTPWKMNGTYMGGNHGCSDARRLTIKNHGLAVADIGSEWTDESGNKFYIIKVPEPDIVWLLSENKGKDEIWKFNTKIKGSDLKNSASGKVLKIEENNMLQIRPAVRIKEQKYLVNGKDPLQENVPTSCEFLDMAEGYDTICPDSLLNMIQNNPGKDPDFAEQSLDSVLTVSTLYRFMPMGACTIEHITKTLKKFNDGKALFVMTAPLKKGDYDKHQHYTPKTLPFEKDGCKYDFKAIQDLPAKLPSHISFSEKDKNIENANNYPDRFIQFLCKKQDDKIVRDVGFVIGYSLIEGLSRPEERSKTTEEAMSIHYETLKTYPMAIDRKIGKTIPAGKEFRCLVYRQYFNPAAFSAATSVYWHKEAGAYMLYIDYHKNVENDVIKLPDYLVGKKVTIVEKTPTLSLLTEHSVPAEGIAISVKDQYGYIVLKLD